eukprot:11406094-Prorocentrum_lima.AAC.1
MTSSLVGSEMCIRDSTPTHPMHHSNNAHDRQPSAQRTYAHGTRSRETPAVSYTHLTLPTICSV